MSYAVDGADVADLTRRIRLVQRRIRRCQSRGDDIEAGVLSAKTLSLLIAVYVFSGHDMDAAVEFLALRARPQEFGRDVLESSVREAFMREPTCRIVELMNDTCLLTWKMRLLSAACLFIVHFRLYIWPGVQNSVHGVAPSRLQMVRYALTATPSDCPLEVQAIVQRPLRGSARRQRKWLQNFRDLWGARLGTLQTVPVMPVREMQEKAGHMGPKKKQNNQKKKGFAATNLGV